MRITHIDGVPVNGTSGIFMTMKRVGEVQPVTVSAVTRNRAGLSPSFSGGHRELMSAPFTVIHEPDKQPPTERVHMNVFHAQVMELFAPSLRERVITAVMSDEGYAEPPTCQVRGRITSFGRKDKEWGGTLLLLDPAWEEVEPTVSSANPLVVGGSFQTWPVVNMSTGSPCTRQMLTAWDRTGHGFSSLMIAVTPAEVWSENNYIIYCEGTPQPFALVGGRLYFRVSVQAETLPTFVDIHMGEDVDGSQFGGQLETFGVDLDASIPNWRYNVSTETVKENGSAPALSWTPAVTGDPPPRRPYSFGMIDEWVHLRDDDMSDDLQTLSNDVDSLTLHTGVEAKQIRNLSIEVGTGYQPAEGEEEGSTTGKKRKVMRCTLKVSRNLGPHYAQWSLGPVTFPRTYSETKSTRSLRKGRPSGGLATYLASRKRAIEVQPPYTIPAPNGINVMRNPEWVYWKRNMNRIENGIRSLESSASSYFWSVTTKTETIWHGAATVADFASALKRYFPTVSISQGGAGVFYIDFGEVDYEIPLMSISIHPRVTNYATNVQEDVNDDLKGVRRSYYSSSSSSSMAGGNIPGIFWESIWVDPVTKKPFDEDPSTSGLRDYSIHGQVRVSVVYRRRDSPHFLTAWSRTVSSTSGERLVAYNDLQLDIPGAVQIAIRIEPVSIQHAYANWGRFRVTSVPEILLDENTTPDIEISEAIDAVVLDGSLTNLTTGEGIRFDQVLVDEPGLTMDMQTGSITPISGVGEWHGRIFPSAGNAMISLDPSQENDWGASGTLDAAEIEWSWHRKVLV